MNRGKLITIEGLDGSGKGTNVQLLEHALIEAGYPTVTYSFPEYDSTVGKVIAKYLQGEFGNVEDVPVELVCTAYAADRARYAEDILTYLENGYIVLCDRYTYSNVFNMVKLDKSKWDNFLDWIEDLEFNCLGVARPDINIYLHVEPTISIKRIKERGKRDYQNNKEDIHESNYELLKNSSEGYLYIANNRDNWLIIDEMKDDKQLPIEVVFSKLFSEVIQFIKK